MKTYSQRIHQLFSQGPAYVGYLTIGDGGHEHCLSMCRALIAGGINLLELGVPFSDPVADGEVIQQASQRALAQQTTIHDVLKLAQQLRQETDVPFVLFSYYNPLLAHGPTIYQDIAAAGIDGILIVDLPIEEANDHLHQCQTNQLDPIFLISPSTHDTRIQQLDQAGRGFLYYVCRNGTTGIKKALPTQFKERMQAIRSLTQLPVITGFGIANRDTAREALAEADGIVIGSLFVKAAADGHSAQQITQLVQSLDPR